MQLKIAVSAVPIRSNPTFVDEIVLNWKFGIPLLFSSFSSSWAIKDFDRVYHDGVCYITLVNQQGRYSLCSRKQDTMVVDIVT